MNYLKYFILFSIILISCKNDDSSIEETQEDDGPDIITISTSITSISQITSDGAMVEATLSVDPAAVVDLGICWSISSNPTLSDNFRSGTSIQGTFIVDISSLTGETTYYARSYINTGRDIIYSSNEQFTTLSDETNTVFRGNVELNTQAQVNDFGENGYTEITGLFFIVESNDITDLTPLNTIETIGGELRIIQNANLTNLNGLNNIKSVDDEVNISFNPLLSTIEGLSNLQFVSSVTIVNNIELSSLDGLDNLSSIGRGLTISQNTMLQNMNGLSSLINIGGGFIVSRNPSLQSFNGLENLTSIGNALVIVDNDSLQNLVGFDSLSSINGQLIIEKNDELINILGLNELISISDELRITQNKLIAIDGFSSLESIGKQLRIWRENIVDIDGFDSIEYIGEIDLNFNNSLTNINGFETLLTVEDNLSIIFNEALNDLCGLTSLIENNGLGGVGTYEVRGNLFNPTRMDILNGNCSQ